MISTELPPLDDEGHLVLTLETILDTWERRLRNRVIEEHLVKWKDFPDEDATWGASRFYSTQPCGCLGTSNIWEGKTLISLPKIFSKENYNFSIFVNLGGPRQFWEKYLGPRGRIISLVECGGHSLMKYTPLNGEVRRVI